MKRTLVLLAVAAGLLAAATPATAAPATAWKGVVVAKDVKRGTVVTASANGAVRTARTPKARTLKIGQRLDVRGISLADGTFKAGTVKANGRARTAKVKAVVVRWQNAQKRLLVSAGGSTFALSRKATRTLASASDRAPQPGDQITATVNLTTATPQATSVSTVGRLGVLEVEGILTKIEAGSIELIVAKTGFVTLALPAGFVLPTGLAPFDEVKAHVAVGTDGKLTLLSVQGDDEGDRDDDGVDVDDEDGELEVTGTITALSETSITVTPGSSASPVTCALTKPLTGFAVKDRVELKCAASGTAGALTLQKIKHDDDDEDDDENDDDDHHHGDGH
ncbi:MAG: hypothetical protein QOF45_2053 [Gaiellaceae bacterium]|jgi:hypothetical protein|nr:hypothetical protein [Gaiellaceae bacterium]